MLLLWELNDEELFRDRHEGRPSMARGWSTKSTLCWKISRFCAVYDKSMRPLRASLSLGGKDAEGSQ